MAEPTLIATSSSTYASGSPRTVGASFTWQTGDRVHVMGGAADDGVTFSTPTGGANLTFSLITTATAASATRVQYWRGVASGAGSGTISATTSGGVAGLSAWQYRDSDGEGTPVSMTGSAAKTQSVVRGQANSHILQLMADWNQVGDVVTDPTPAGGNQRVEVAVSGQADFFATDWGDQGATGTTSYGITNHTGTVKMSGIAVEILGTAAGATDNPQRRRWGGIPGMRTGSAW